MTIALAALDYATAVLAADVHLSDRVRAWGLDEVSKDRAVHIGAKVVRLLRAAGVA